MSRPDPNATLARHHGRHTSPQLGCPACMRAAVAPTLPRWARAQGR